MIFFSQRKAIEKMFLAWCEEHSASTIPANLVAFMEIKGWLNEEKIKEDIPLTERKE